MNERKPIFNRESIKISNIQINFHLESKISLKEKASKNGIFKSPFANGRI